MIRCLLLVAATLAGPVLADDSFAGFVGRIATADVDEASGLARSHRHPDRYWVLNDGGDAPMLYAIGPDGSYLGAVRIADARNRDWEDLASYEQDGRPMLVIADIGDNAGRRRNTVLYFVEEPEPDPNGRARAAVSRRISVSLPSGAADAESLAVDVDAGHILILTKRDIPARLYALPLATDGEAVTASALGSVASLPQPSADDIARAPKLRDWHWQPTGMDIAPDGKVLAVLTYRSVYLYRRDAGQSWPDAVGEAPQVLPLNGIPFAEAVTFSADGRHLFVTTEGRRPPLLRFSVR